MKYTVEPPKLDDLEQQRVQSAVAQFFKEHFLLEEGAFASRRSDSVRGNLRFGFSHYLIGNVNVALLTGFNERWASEFNIVQDLVRSGSEACYAELFGAGFSVRSFVILDERSRPSRFAPAVTITNGFAVRFKDFKFIGDLTKAMAYFTFARLTK